MTDKSPMKIGMVGLGRAGHQCRVYDVSEQAVKQLVGAGAEGQGRWPTWWPAWPPRARCG
jgi:hypothetical protein